MNRALLNAIVVVGVCSSMSGPVLAKSYIQDSPFEKLKSYDFQNRTPSDAISALIQQANGDKAKLAQIEVGLDGVIDDASSAFAGKQEACRLLSIIGTGTSVPSLSKLLIDPQTSDIARYALERNSDPSAAKALRSALAKTDGKIQIGIINTLGDKLDPIAPGVLKKYIVSPDALVSEAAIAALGKIGNADAISLLKKLPVTSVIAGHALLKSAAQLAASKAADTPSTALYELLASPQRPAIIRAEAIRGLSVTNAPNAAKYAIDALKSDDPYLQEVAARVIGTIGTKAAVNPAMEIWPHLPASTQIILLTAFADRKDKSATPIAFTAIDSKDATLRAAGMRSAALIGGPSVVTKLVDILVNGEGADRGVARESLATMPGEEAEKSLLQLVSTSDSKTKAALMNVLSERPTAGAVAAMITVAEGADANPAVQALQALGRVGRRQTFPELLKILVGAKSDDIRDAAKDAVGAIAQKLDNHGSSDVYSVFAGAPQAAQVALYPVLAEIGDERALAELTKSAESPTAELRQPAISALADNWSDDRALPTLLNIAKTDPDRSLKVQTLRGYLRLLAQDEKLAPEDKVARLVDAISIAIRPEERRQAISALRDCRIVAAVSAAAKFLDKAELFNDAANTIINLAGKQRKNNKDQAAVAGPEVTEALDTIIQLTRDDGQRNAAQKVKGQ